MRLYTSADVPATIDAVGFSALMYTDITDPLPKPPLGLRPRSCAIGECAASRLQEILAAMGRYVAEGKRLPVEWIYELDDLNGGLCHDS